MFEKVVMNFVFKRNLFPSSTLFCECMCVYVCVCLCVLLHTPCGKYGAMSVKVFVHAVENVEACIVKRQLRVSSIGKCRAWRS